MKHYESILLLASKLPIKTNDRMESHDLCIAEAGYSEGMKRAATGIVLFPQDIASLKGHFMMVEGGLPILSKLLLCRK